MCQGFHDRLRKIPGFTGVPDDMTKWPNMPLPSAFAAPDSLGLFKEAVRWVGERV